MRFLILALLLSACAAYPKIDWPSGPAGVATPALLPQADFAAPVTGADPGPALLARARVLRGASAAGTP